MPRNGSGVFSKPAGTTAVTATTIESAKYNSTIDDLVTDANTVRPIVAGGTAASTAAGALVNLGLTATAAEINLLDGKTIETTATDVTTAIPDSRALFRGRGWEYLTQQATTSGTVFDFDIPSWATEIKLLLNGVSLSSTGDLSVQIGDAGGIEATGYTSASASLSHSTAVRVDDYTTGFGIFGGNLAASFSGEIVLTKYGSSTWTSSHAVRRGSATVATGGGIKSLSAALTTVRLTRIGPDNFDAGDVNACYR